MHLAQHRQAIDTLDLQLLDLLNQRANHAMTIGEAKLKQGAISLYDPGREAKLLDKLEQANQGPLQDTQLRTIYREIISACLALEQVQRIVYLGPEGTFTHMAALSHFGCSANYSYKTSIADIFHALIKEEYDYAVAPIENSTEGMVSMTIDLLATSQVQIIGELEIPVRHCLLGQSGLDLANIKQVHAHEQALAQCQHWLRQHLPHASLHKQPSNGLAVQTALNHQDAAAVGAEVNARLYNLTILAKNVEDIAGNKTRFVVLGRDTTNGKGKHGSLVQRTGKDKTALLFAVRHQPGALYRALGAISSAGLDMTRLESRPLKTSSWSYSFFVELRGHISDAPVQQALAAMEPECTFTKFLGSYPGSS